MFVVVALALACAIAAGLWWQRAVQTLGRATLRLVDDRGQPAAGLDVFAEHRSLFRSQVVGLGSSDERGEVDLAALKELGVVGSVTFTVEMIGFETPDVPWQERMTIVVPRHGEVTLQLVDADGAPWAEAHAADAIVSMRWSGEWGSRSAKFDGRGRAELGVVACDSRVPLDLRLHFASTTAELVAPPPGDHVVQHVAVPDEGPRLRGVLVREDGSPIGEQVSLRGEMRLRRGSRSFSAFHLHPDPAGRFEFLLENWPESGTVTIGDRTGREATVELRPIVGGDALDVGELRLSR